MRKTVVILLSDKRSGSTMFENELCKHPEIQHVGYTPHTYSETHHWLKGAVILGMAPETFSGRKVYQGYGSRSNAKSYLIDCLQKNVPKFKVPDDDRELVFHGWEALCEQYSKPVFFEKSPQFLAHWSSLSLILEWIKSTEYDVKVIGLTRNPLSVLYSAFELFHTPPGRRQFGWLEIQKNLLAFQALLPDGVFMHVKYEDIITRPEATFSDVCHFIGVSEGHSIGANVHCHSVNKWKSDLNFTVRLDETVKQVARHFGYTDEELDNPVKPEPSIGYKSKVYIGGKLALMRARLRDRLVKPLYLKLRQWM